MSFNPLQRTNLVLALLVPVALSASAAESPPRPDILLIMPDQMRGDCMSIVRHPVVRTPTLDGLARGGMLFRRAYSTVPSCIPARHALLTGLFPQTSGVVGFRQRSITVPTMPRILGDAGYATVLVGRAMHQAASEAELGYQRAILGSTYVAHDQYAADLRQAAPEITDIRSWVTSLGLSYNHWQARPWPLDNALHPTTWIIEHARRLLAEPHDGRPLFLTASFYAPHPPLFPPDAHFQAVLRRPLAQTAHGDWVDWASLKPEGTDGGSRVLLQGETLRRAQAGYFGLIEQLDHELAPLIAEFRARSEKAGRPWLILFTSDHGEMLGDHGYFRKCEPFEGSANIPLIVAGSPELGFVRDAQNQRPVCLEDILPTLAEIAGADCPAHDGTSLIATLRGASGEIRPWLHSEHAPCYSKGQAFHALTDGRYKYIWRPLDGHELLFDLGVDPHEEHDLALAPDHRESLETWRRRLVAHLAGRPEGFSDGQRLISGRPYPAIQVGR